MQNQQTILKAIEAYETISGKELVELDFNSQNLSGAEFENCTFKQVDFSEAQLGEARFRNCAFKQCSFRGVDGKGVQFSNCNFFDSDNGKGGTFNYAELRNALFESCNLSTSSFKGALLFEARFEDCTAQGCTFEDATFSYVLGGRTSTTSLFIRASNFDYAQFKNLSLEGCTLTENSFRETDFSGCDFTDADLNGSNLAGADTIRAIFDGADLRETNLQGMQLGALASFDNMKINQAQQKDLLTGLGIRVFD